MVINCETNNIENTNMIKKYVTRLALSQDDYLILLEALQLFITKATSANFDGLVALYGHVKEQYGRRTQEEMVSSLPKDAKAVVSTRVDWNETPAPAKKKMGKKVAVIEMPDNEETEVEDRVEAHPFLASKRKSWICQSCGKSRNSSYHKNSEGKLWLPKK